MSKQVRISISIGVQRNINTQSVLTYFEWALEVAFAVLLGVRGNDTVPEGRATRPLEVAGKCLIDDACEAWLTRA